MHDERSRGSPADLPQLPAHCLPVLAHTGHLSISLTSILVTPYSMLSITEAYLCNKTTRNYPCLESSARRHRSLGEVPYANRDGAASKLILRRLKSLLAYSH